MKPAISFSSIHKLRVNNVVHRFRGIVIVSALIFSSAVIAEELDATLLWANKVPLSTPVSGVVAEVNVVAGDFVKKNSVLLRLDTRSQYADVQAQQAAVKRADNDREEAGRELERTQELYDRTLISDHDLEVKVIENDAAIAKHQMEKSLLVKAKLNLEYATVKAPSDAWVVSREVAVGQTIISRLQATPLLELVEAGKMLARTVVSVKRLSSLRMGNKATITVAGKQYQGQVARIALEPATPGLSEYDVDVMFNSGEAGSDQAVLRAGFPAKVNFE